ncbi:hypothetical protein V8C44DRAFT_317602 [Trichoderma aethiopicum]
MYMCVPYLTRRAERRAECHRKPLRISALCLCALLLVRACFACVIACLLACLPAMVVLGACNLLPFTSAHTVGGGVLERKGQSTW